MSTYRTVVLNIFIFAFVNYIANAAPLITEEVKGLYKKTNHDNGNYRKYLSLSNGIFHTEDAEYKEVNNKKILKLVGTYSFQDEKGIQYQVYYTADENGYHARPTIITVPLPASPPLEMGINPKAISTIVFG